MKRVKLIGLTVMLCFLNQLSIYTYSVPKLEGGTQSLSAYQGKKILIITLPVQQNASTDSMLFSLDTLGAAHAASLAIIGVPSYEDGYTPNQKNQLLQWYRSKMRSHILITEGLRTRKTSGGQQHPLFGWLSKIGFNKVFDEDITGPGHKFFVQSNGELYGELKPQVKISSSAVYRTLQIR